MKIKFHKSIKIHFRLPKQKPKQIKIKPPSSSSNTSLSYTIVATKPTESKKENTPRKKSFSYTIKIN